MKVALFLVAAFCILVTVYGGNDKDGDRRSNKVKDGDGRGDGDKTDKVKDGDGDKGKHDKNKTSDYNEVLEYWMPESVSPEDLHNFTDFIGGVLPRFLHNFTLVVNATEKFSNDIDNKTAAVDILGDLNHFNRKMNETGHEVFELYWRFYDILYRITRAGFSWDKTNDQLFSMLFYYHVTDPVLLAEALVRDIKGIKMEISEFLNEVNLLPDFNRADSVPRPVEAVKTIAGVQYRLEKISYDFQNVLFGVHTIIDALNEKLEARKCSTEGIDVATTDKDNKVIQLREVLELFERQKKEASMALKGFLDQFTTKPSVNSVKDITHKRGYTAKLKMNASKTRVALERSLERLLNRK